MGPRDVGFLEDRAFQRRVAQNRPTHDHAAEVGAGKVGLRKVRALQVGAFERGVAKLRIALGMPPVADPLSPAGVIAKVPLVEVEALKIEAGLVGAGHDQPSVGIGFDHVEDEFDPAQGVGVLERVPAERVF